MRSKRLSPVVFSLWHCCELLRVTDTNNIEHHPVPVSQSTLALVPIAAITNHHNLGGWNNTNLLSFHSGGQRPKVSHAGLKSMCQQAASFSGDSRGESISLPPPTSRGCLRFPAVESTIASWALLTVHYSDLLFPHLLLWLWLGSSTFKDRMIIGSSPYLKDSRVASYANIIPLCLVSRCVQVVGRRMGTSLENLLSANILISQPLPFCLCIDMGVPTKWKLIPTLVYSCFLYLPNIFTHSASLNS